MTTAVIQAGHFDRKVGSTGTNGEQTYNLVVARMAVAELRRRGVTAKWIDADEPSSRYTADHFIAIHADGSTSKSAQGSSVGYRNSRGKTLAQAIKARYQTRAKAAGYPLRFRADNYTTALGRYYGTGYALAQNPACRAVIVEGGFLTNPTERRFLNSTAGRTALALGIADAITGAQEDDDMTPQELLRTEVWSPALGKNVTVDDAITGALGYSKRALEAVNQVKALIDPEAFAERVAARVSSKVGASKADVKAALAEVLREGTEPEG